MLLPGFFSKDNEFMESKLFFFLLDRIYFYGRVDGCLWFCCRVVFFLSWCLISFSSLPCVHSAHSFNQTVTSSLINLDLLITGHVINGVNTFLKSPVFSLRIYIRVLRCNMFNVSISFFESFQHFIRYSSGSQSDCGSFWFFDFLVF